MQYRTFGRTGWQVSEVGYGMWGMAGWTGSDDAESLASLVREGTVHPAHAFRKAPNRDQFMAALRRSGIDTAIAERLG